MTDEDVECPECGEDVRLESDYGQLYKCLECGIEFVHFFVYVENSCQTHSHNSVENGGR